MTIASDDAASMNGRHGPRGLWAVAIFTSRESARTVMLAIESTIRAATHPIRVEILVNGNPVLAQALQQELADHANSNRFPPIRLWRFDLGDKAHAWNEYLHFIWEGEQLAFFMDGYVRLHARAIDLLGEAVLCDERALAGTGAPTVGRTAETQRQTMVHSGGMQGNFCCMKAEAIQVMKARKIRLPLGLYRTDVLISTLMAFGMDPIHTRWDHRRIRVLPTASWDNDKKRWWVPADVRAQFKRVLRQSRGNLENLAVRDFFKVKRLQPAELPRTIDELVSGWMDSSSHEFRRAALRNPMNFYAARHFRTSRDYLNADHPTLVRSLDGIE